MAPEVPEHKDLLEHLVLLEPLDQLDSRVPLEDLEQWEQLVCLEDPDPVVHLDKLDSQDHREQLVPEVRIMHRNTIFFWLVMKLIQCHHLILVI